MSYDETLIGSIAMIMALISFLIAFGPWAKPYQLPTMMAVSRRYGKAAARGLWLLIALASLASGVAILGGLRPGYAEPAPGLQISP